MGLSAADAGIGGMALCDCFSAADDRVAVAVLRTPGGPGQAELDVASLKNIGPVVAIAQHEALMTGCTREEAGERPRSGRLLSESEDGPPFLVSLSGTLVDALATATRGALAGFAEPWSLTGELRLYCWRALPPTGVRCPCPCPCSAVRAADGCGRAVR
ncbi:hypothetical protein [Streptomyces olivaceoviridis]|uniref:hypothetical protein n=1 Tax=Streptomyces olivaceoviridis TaxID=1921 RepID=UPI00378F31F1